MTDAPSGSTNYPRLFEPLQMGRLTLANRIVLGAHGTLYSEPSREFGEPGFFGARMGRYCEDRARGGVGLIIAGQAEVHPNAIYHSVNGPNPYAPESVDRYREMSEPVHRHGVPIFLQLGHSGPVGPASWSKLPLMSPSGIRTVSEIPKVMERHEIAEVLDHYRVSAANAVAGGFDGIELHGAHRYLVVQFLSPITNRRTDDYGGNADKRMRFAIEALEAVREGAGDAVVGIRLIGDEERPGGITPEDAAAIAGRLEELGLVDYVNVSVGWGGKSRVPPLYSEHALFAPVAAVVKKGLKSTPVLVAHRITTPAEAEAVLERDQADAVVVVRALISDPEWPKKARTGLADTIRLCTGCNQGCVGQTAAARPMSCVHNPVVGRETELGHGTLTPAAETKRVVVVGGGPGGLEAAWVAAARGHQVILLEKDDQLGGKMRLAERLPGRAEIGGFATWRAAECERRGVDIRLGVDATADTILALAPDAVVVATGSRPRTAFPTLFYPEPPIGADAECIVHYTDAVRSPEALGAKVVVLDLIGFVQGVGVSELLAASGRDVTLVMPFPEPTQMEADNLTAAMRRVMAAGVAFHGRMLIDAIEGRQVSLRSTLGGAGTTISDVDHVVLCAYDSPADDLYFALLERMPSVTRIGDAV